VVVWLNMSYARVQALNKWDYIYTIENIYGSSYDDILVGNNGNNVIFAGNGNDEIYRGGTGTKTIDG